MEIGFGCAFLHKSKKPERLIEYALNKGIKYFDVAPTYGRFYGENEKYLGSVLNNIGKDLEHIIIATKILARRKQDVLWELEGIKNRLPKIDILQLHSVDTLNCLNLITSDDGALSILQRLKDQGIISKIGITNHYDPEVLKIALEKFEFDTFMLPLGPLNFFRDRELESRGKISFRQLAKIIQNQKKKVIGILILGAGLITDKKLVRKSLLFVFNQPVDVVLIGFTKENEIDFALEVFQEFKKGTNLSKSEFLTILKEIANLVRKDKPWWWQAPVDLGPFENSQEFRRSLKLL